MPYPHQSPHRKCTHPRSRRTVFPFVPRCGGTRRPKGATIPKTPRRLPAVPSSSSRGSRGSRPAFRTPAFSVAAGRPSLSWTTTTQTLTKKTACNGWRRRPTQMGCCCRHRRRRRRWWTTAAGRGKYVASNSLQMVSLFERESKQAKISGIPSEASSSSSTFPECDSGVYYKLVASKNPLLSQRISSAAFDSIRFDALCCCRQRVTFAEGGRYLLLLLTSSLWICGVWVTILQVLTESFEFWPRFKTKFILCTTCIHGWTEGESPLIFNFPNGLWCSKVPTLTSTPFSPLLHPFYGPLTFGDFK